MSAPTIVATRVLPSMSAAEWNDAATVHAIAVGQDSKELCAFCSKQFLQHRGPLRVVPNEAQPEYPLVFGNAECEAKWRSWRERSAKLPQSYDVSGFTSIPVTVVDGVMHVEGDAAKSTWVSR